MEGYSVQWAVLFKKQPTLLERGFLFRPAWINLDQNVPETKQFFRRKENLRKKDILRHKIKSLKEKFS